MHFEGGELPFDLVEHLVMRERDLLNELHPTALEFLFETAVTPSAASKSLEKMQEDERRRIVERVRRAPEFVPAVHKVWRSLKRIGRAF